MHNERYPVKLNSESGDLSTCSIFSFFFFFFATKISTPYCPQSIAIAQSNSQIKHSTKLMSNNKYLTSLSAI